MTIYLKDFRIKTSQIQSNLEAMVSSMNEAIQNGDELIIFPQLSLSGLYCNDLFKSPSFLRDLDDAHQTLLNYSKDIRILFGSVLIEDGKLFNAIFDYQNGSVNNHYIKTDLNHYESQYFSTKASESSININGVNYNLVFDLSEANGKSIIFAYDQFDKNQTSLNYDGIYVNPLGIANLNAHVFVYPGGSGYSGSVQYKMLDVIIKALQSFDDEILSYKPNWMIGVSGGLDSSVTVALLSLAFGSDRVIGVNMPSEYSSSQTKGNAAHLASVLGYESYIIPIKDMTYGTQSAFSSAGLGPIENLAYENVQARLRGHTLMTLSSIKNGVISNNGNKIETALGYATLYGDAIGVLGILADLNKLEVGQLAKDINEKEQKEVIPFNLIPEMGAGEIKWDFAPSAELANAQVDPMKWGYHDHLVEYLLEHPVESLLESYVDKSIYETELGSYLKTYGLDDGETFINDLEWVLRTMNLAKYKRKQSPPMLILSKHIFAQESQGLRYESSTYKHLVKQIKEL